MPNKMQKRTGVLAAIATLAAAGIVSFGHADEPTIRVQWTAPTTGSAVEHYVGEVQSWVTDSPDTIAFTFVSQDTTASFTYAYGHETRCRVAGVDSLGRQGPYSGWSLIWSDHGIPGAPSIPRMELEMVEQ